MEGIKYMNMDNNNSKLFNGYNIEIDIKCTIMKFVVNKFEFK